MPAFRRFGNIANDTDLFVEHNFIIIPKKTITKAMVTILMNMSISTGTKRFIVPKFRTDVSKKFARIIMLILNKPPAISREV